MSERDGQQWSSTTHSVADRPPGSTPEADVSLARRGAASFGAEERLGMKQSVRMLARRYGWRAYALPVLVVITVAALLTVHGGSPHHPSASRAGTTAQKEPARHSSTPPVADGDISLKSDTPSQSNANYNPLTLGALPEGAAYTKTGTGTFRVIRGTSKVVGTSTDGHGVWRYDVEVENGITGVDVNQFANMVQTVLADPRSWSGHGVALQRVDSGRVDFHVSLTSAMTVRKYCGYDIPVETSCYAQASATDGKNRVVFDVARWVRGAAPYVGDLTAYRTYMINHEDGHALGHNHAHQCLPDGLAPAMMQQTFGLKSATTGKNCGANPWPYPPGATGAPGAEQADTQKNSEYYLGD